MDITVSIFHCCSRIHVKYRCDIIVDTQADDIFKRVFSKILCIGFMPEIHDVVLLTWTSFCPQEVNPFCRQMS